MFTPSLTGVGERVHLVSPQVDLSTHVQDVVNQIRYEDLAGVVLLGFSYGGFVVTGALAHVADRVRALVFLDAYVPDDGDTVFGLTGGGPEDPPALDGGSWLIPPAERTYEDPEEAVFATTRRTPQPVACFTEPVRLARPLEDFPFSRTYIRATADPPGARGAAAFDRAAARASSSPAWRYREIATGHLVPYNRPRELADLLLELA